MISAYTFSPLVDPPGKHDGRWEVLVSRYGMHGYHSNEMRMRMPQAGCGDGGGV